MNIFDNKDECFILRSGVFLEYKMGFDKLDRILPLACETLEWRFNHATEEEVQEGIKREEARYKKQLKDSIGE
jgi:hypothetical protein